MNIGEDVEFGIESAMPEPDRPGLYYVTMYLPLPDGTLMDETTTHQYRARNEQIARTRALKEHPLASIVHVDFHVDDEDDEEPVDEL